ncbi:MAG: hypothetical protein ACYDEP_13805 [Acidimicrobiales bacterium]
MPYKSCTPEGRFWLLHEAPLSEVARMRSGGPITKQSEVEGHAMPYKSCTPEGRFWLVHIAPLSEVAIIVPLELFVLLPTA